MRPHLPASDNTGLCLLSIRSQAQKQPLRGGALSFRPRPSLAFLSDPAPRLVLRCALARFCPAARSPSRTLMRRAVLLVCHCFTHPGARARAMLFPRVAALPGIWLLRVRRVQHALSLAGTLPRPVRAVSAGSRALGSVWASDGPVRGGGREDPREDEEEEDELLRVPPLLPFDAQRVCVLHPDVKRRAGKTPRSTGNRYGESGDRVGKPEGAGT